MRVVVLNWLDRENPQAGGAEVHLHQSFGRLAQKGWAVTVVSSGWPGCPARAELDGMQIVRVGGRYSYPLHVRSQIDELGIGGFDLVVEDLNKAPLFTPSWVTTPCLLLVHHLFGTTVFQEARWPLAFATWALERPIPYVYRRIPVVAVSESTRSDLIRRGMDPSSIDVIENGIDTHLLQPVPAEDEFEFPTVLYLGRLKRYKRVDLILKAIARLRAENEPVRLLVAGRGDYGQSLREEARTLGLDAGTVEFLGFVAEERKVELLQRAWVHTLTSPKEGWGIANLEAAACGTPTVASDSPGLRDSVIHDRTGFLVPHGDVDTLAIRLRQLLRDTALRRSMGAAAREFSEGLSWDLTTNRLALALEAAATQSPRSARRAELA